MTRSAVENPFTPGYGNLPRVFAGREAEFADLELMGRRVRRGTYEQARQLTGVRGIGKTALLREYAHWAEEEGLWVVEMAAVPG
ncbi:MAG TPA: ATP-binding protein, partial [Euzebya sp.]|nr:ATP-binding protein [Euzebya sp.]